jgi:hypothetical protein
MQLFLISVPSIYFFYRLDDYDVDSFARPAAVTVGITFLSVSIMAPEFQLLVRRIIPVDSHDYSLGIAALLVLTVFLVAPAFGRIRPSMSPDPVLREPKRNVRDTVTSAVSRIRIENVLLFLILTVPSGVMIFRNNPEVGWNEIYIHFVGMLVSGSLNWSAEPGATVAQFTWGFNPGYFTAFMLGWALPIAFIYYLLKYRRGLTTKKRLAIISLLSLLPYTLMAMSVVPIPSPVIVGLLYLRFSSRPIDYSPKEGQEKREEETEVTIPFSYLIISRIRETLRSEE